MNSQQLRILHALERASERSISEGWVTTADVAWELDNAISPRGIANSLNALVRRQFVDGLAHTMGSDVITKWKPRS